MIFLLVSDFQKSSLHPRALLELRRHWFYKICCPFFLSSLCLLLLFQYFLCSQSWTLRMIHVSVVVHFPVDLQPTEMVPASHQGNSIILNFPKKVLVKADIKQLSPKKMRSFDENWRNTSLIRTREDLFWEDLTTYIGVRCK